MPIQAPLLVIAAAREMSVILAALTGWRFKSEGFGPLRTAWAVLIFLGIVLISVAG
ncbi:MAG: hypothetical protein WAW37_03530 [Syntrophobacteraceae bacterium]